MLKSGLFQAATLARCFQELAKGGGRGGGFWSFIMASLMASGTVYIWRRPLAPGTFNFVKRKSRGSSRSRESVWM